MRIAFEELRYIKKNYDLVDNNGYDKKKVHVRWNDKTDKWYPVAMFLITKLVTDTTPVEFVTELLLPFTTEGLRESSNPLEAIRLVEPEKYAYQSKFVNRFTYFLNAAVVNDLQRKWARKSSFHWNLPKQMCIILI